MEKDDFVNKVYIKVAVVFAAIIIVVVVIFLGIIPLINKSERPAFLDVLVTPVDATVTVNDKEMNNAVYEMEPGEYTAIITRDGFVSVTMDLKLEKDKTTGIYLNLVPDDGDWEFYEDIKNQQSLNVLLRLNGVDVNGKTWEPVPQLAEENVEAKSIADRYKIKALTPIYLSICGTPANRMNCNAVHVDYRYSKRCGDKLCLVITGRTRELDSEALDKVKSELLKNGYNLDDQEYIYVWNPEL